MLTKENRLRLYLCARRLNNCTGIQVGLTFMYITFSNITVDQYKKEEIIKYIQLIYLWLQRQFY